MTTAAQTMTNKIAEIDDDTLLQSIKLINARCTTSEARLVRARMIGEYESRHGEDATDDLLDALGL